MVYRFRLGILVRRLSGTTLLALASRKTHNSRSSSVSSARPQLFSAQSGPVACLTMCGVTAMPHRSLTNRHVWSPPWTPAQRTSLSSRCRLYVNSLLLAQRRARARSPSFRASNRLSRAANQSAAQLTPCTREERVGVIDDGGVGNAERDQRCRHLSLPEWTPP